MKKQLPVKKQDNLPAVFRTYTADEIALVQQYFKKKETEPPRFKVDDSIKNMVGIAPDETDATFHRAKMLRAFGTDSDDLQNHFINQLLPIFKGCSSKTNAQQLVTACNMAVTLLDEIRPRDLVEGMLITQMIGIHNMGMEVLAKAMLAGQTAEIREASIHQATKLLRTFSQQMDTLKNYRQKGQQKVTVEHVNVNSGGQAIIGSVTGEGGGVEKIS